jgi:hypothetical protein
LISYYKKRQSTLVVHDSTEQLIANEVFPVDTLRYGDSLMRYKTVSQNPRQQIGSPDK